MSCQAICRQASAFNPQTDQKPAEPSASGTSRRKKNFNRQRKLVPQTRRPALLIANCIWMPAEFGSAGRFDFRHLRVRLRPVRALFRCRRPPPAPGGMLTVTSATSLGLAIVVAIEQFLRCCATRRPAVLRRHDQSTRRRKVASCKRFSRRSLKLRQRQSDRSRSQSVAPRPVGVTAFNSSRSMRGRPRYCSSAPVDRQSNP